MTSESVLWTVVSVLGLLVIVLTLLVVGLLRRAAPILERAERLLAGGVAGGPTVLEGLPIGSPVDPFVVDDLSGRPTVASDVLAGPRTVILLLSTHCEPCRGLSQEMVGQDWATSATRLVVIQSVETGADPLPVCADAETYIQGASQEASVAFGSNITPHAFVVDARATVLAKAIPESLAQLRTLAKDLGTPSTVNANGRVENSHHDHAHPETSIPEVSFLPPAETASSLSRRPNQTR